MSEFKLTIILYGVNQNHAERRLQAIVGENLCVYLGAGKAGHPIFTVKSVEVIHEDESEQTGTS